MQEREREKELALIKAQYLGAEKKKKKVLKGAEKFKFNFDWEAGDDTSRDLNPLYNQTHGVCPTSSCVRVPCSLPGSAKKIFEHRLAPSCCPWARGLHWQPVPLRTIYMLW